MLEQLAADAAPPEAQLAQEYIEGNAGRAITLEELAEAAGTNAFGLFSAFKRYRGYSPLTFLSQVRWKGGGLRK